MHRPGRSPRGIRTRRLGNEGSPALGRRVPKDGQASSSGPAQPGCRRRGDRTLIRPAARRVLNRARRRVGKCYETPSVFPGSEGAFSFLSRRFDDAGSMPFSLYLPEPQAPETAPRFPRGSEPKARRTADPRRQRSCQGERCERLSSNAAAADSFPPNPSRVGEVSGLRRPVASPA